MRKKIKSLRLPKSVFVGDSEYRVIQVAKLDADTVGLCDPSDHTIKILRSLNSKAKFKTFLHELIHAFEFEYDLPLKHKYVYLLENAIYEFMLDNIF